MSLCDRRGIQLDPEDWNAAGMPWSEDDDAPIVVHYGTRTALTTVGTAAARLGLTPSEYRGHFIDLVGCGHFTPRPDGSFDAEGCGE
ncbi:hypothetical protein [Nocardioides donggukensis]|uniref:Uncharacterized protein n=1 Tax=Nocardioides donggukensis TaxID=2774019 RepID=A0A927Q1B0_9ACTN|nr:hypothetical protein [Nocardioides donggukensis]MBD8869294.1 hypothetical protein [Nocardioides donggukensis]